jgi:hypothetical protein
MRTRKGEGRRMVFLGPQDPRPRLVSDTTVSGEYPSRGSERPEYKK